MSQLPSLAQDYPLQQYDEIQAVFNAGIKAINALEGLTRWELMETLHNSLQDNGTPESQWREMDSVLERAEGIAISQKNVQSLVKFDQMREIAARAAEGHLPCRS